MLRGLLGEQLAITGPSRDLHSGLYGGAAINPARVLARIIAALHDDRSRVTVASSQDGVVELPDAVRTQWQTLGSDHVAFLGAVGLSVPAGEQDRTPLEMVWSRPTCEVSGLWSGFQGEGFKTVLPSEASARISFRLVGTQDPGRIRNSFRAMVTTMLPADCSVRFTSYSASPASQIAIDHPAFDRARRALGDGSPGPAAIAGSGGSIPIAGYFKTIQNMDSMLIGFGREDDQTHSPHEKYDLRSFQTGIRNWARILAALSDDAPPSSLA